MKTWLAFFLLLPFAQAVCTPFNSSAVNQSLSLNFSACLYDNATNITITAPGYPKLNQTVQFRYADYGVPALLNFSWPEANLTVFNAPLFNANISLLPGTSNLTYSQSLGVSAFCSQAQNFTINQTILVCPQSGATVQLDYGAEYKNATYGLVVRAPAACVNQTVNVTVLPSLNVDRTLQTGEVYSNATLGFRLECAKSQGFQVEKEIESGECFSAEKTYYETLSLCAKENPVAVVTPEPTPTPTPEPTLLNNSAQQFPITQPPQQNDALTSILGGAALAGVIIFTFKNKIQGGTNWQSTTQSQSQ